MLIRLKTNVGSFKLQCNEEWTLAQMIQSIIQQFHISPGTRIAISFDLEGSRTIGDVNSRLSALGIINGIELYLIGKFEKKVVDKAYVKDGEVVPAGTTLIRVDQAVDEVSPVAEARQPIEKPIIAKQSSVAEEENFNKKLSASPIFDYVYEDDDMMAIEEAQRDLAEPSVIDEVDGLRAPDNVQQMRLIDDVSDSDALFAARLQQEMDMQGGGMSVEDWMSTNSSRSSRSVRSGYSNKEWGKKYEVDGKVHATTSTSNNDVLKLKSKDGLKKTGLNSLSVSSNIPVTPSSGSSIDVSLPPSPPMVSTVSSSSIGSARLSGPLSLKSSGYKSMDEFMKNQSTKSVVGVSTKSSSSTASNVVSSNANNSLMLDDELNRAMAKSIEEAIARNMKNKTDLKLKAAATQQQSQSSTGSSSKLNSSNSNSASNVSSQKEPVRAITDGESKRRLSGSSAMSNNNSKNIKTSGIHETSSNSSEKVVMQNIQNASENQKQKQRTADSNALRRNLHNGEPLPNHLQKDVQDDADDSLLAWAMNESLNDLQRRPLPTNVRTNVVQERMFDYAPRSQNENRQLRFNDVTYDEDDEQLARAIQDSLNDT